MEGAGHLPANQAAVQQQVRVVPPRLVLPGPQATAWVNFVNPAAGDTVTQQATRTRLRTFTETRYRANCCAYCGAPHGRKNCPFKKEIRKNFGEDVEVGALIADFEAQVQSRIFFDQVALAGEQARRINIQRREHCPLKRRRPDSA